MAFLASDVNCLGVRVSRPTLHEFLEWFDSCADCKSACSSLGFVNAHTLNLSCENFEFAKTLNSFSMVLNDGAGLELYGKLSGKHFPYNFNGTDLLPTIFQHRSELQRELRVFLFGAKPGVAAEAARNIESRFSAVRVVGVRDGYSALSDESLLAEINATNPQLVLVALGNPLQEKWIERNSKHLNAGVVAGIGALLDFLSGTVPRAPEWMRKFRLEWFYRLCLEPKRMVKRYVLGNPLFVLRAVVFLFIKGGRNLP